MIRARKNRDIHLVMALLSGYVDDISPNDITEKEPSFTLQCSYDQIQHLADLIVAAEIYAVEEFDVKKIIVNPPATIIFWKDGTKTVTKQIGKYEFDLEKDIAVCFMKKALKNRSVVPILEKADKAAEDYVYRILKERKKKIHDQNQSIK